MSYITEHCTEECAAMPKCWKCGRTKAPHSRSIPLEAANVYCNYDCPAYAGDPKPGHLWPNEWRDHIASEDV